MQGPLDARVDQLASASRPPPAKEDIRAQLERIIGSPEFPNAGHAFLRYVVGEAVAGRAERIKGYSIAVEVFNRDEGFNQDDPVVWIEAGRLRRTLERYYLVAGQNDPVRIDIPKSTTQTRSVHGRCKEWSQKACREGLRCRTFTNDEVQLKACGSRRRS